MQDGVDAAAPILSGAMDEPGLPEKTGVEHKVGVLLLMLTSL
jgi:hypothetical protein